MLDVHVLISHDTRSEWVAQCIGSIRVAIALAGFPVRFHGISGMDGHIGKARANGYAAGSELYVTCVDDDDYVLPGAFEQIGKVLRLNPSAIFTPELTLQNGHLRPGLPRHHLVAYRREHLIDHAKWPSCGDLAQINAIESDAIDLTEPMYVHRLYKTSKARIMRRTRPDELELARA